MVLCPEVNDCKRQEREITIRFQENANRKVVDYKIIEFQKFLSFQNYKINIKPITRKVLTSRAFGFRK